MTKNVTVVKVPLPQQVRKEYPKAFPKMPILYLELVENKSKIKPEMVNTDYISLDKDVVVEKFAESPKKDSPAPQIEFDDSDASPKSSPAHSSPDRSDSDDNQSPEKSASSTPTRKELNGSSSAGSERLKKDKISHRLRELLDDDDNERVTPPKHTHTSENPPSLNDLAKTGQFSRRKEMMDIGHITMTDQDRDDAKRELKFKFDLLKKSYKTDNIPEFSIHSDYETMKRSYESTVRTLSLDRSVDDYKKYLSYGFIGMEFLLGHVFKLDMNGFARQQMVSMNSYERLLIELGEKSYVPTGSKWSVEVRLIFLVVVNTAVFLVSRMMMKKTGSDFMGMMNSMNGSSQSSGSIPMKKRKMKGPTLNVDDIPDINETSEN